MPVIYDMKRDEAASAIRTEAIDRTSLILKTVGNPGMQREHLHEILEAFAQKWYHSGKAAGLALSLDAIIDDTLKILYREDATPAGKKIWDMINKVTEETCPACGRSSK